MADEAPETPIAARSAEAPPDLDRPICLRCSKRIAEDHRRSGLNCSVSAYKACEYCSRGHHPCKPVPVEWRDVVNNLIELKTSLGLVPADDPERAGCVAALADRQRIYIAAVEGTLRVAAKHGGQSKPKSALDATMLMVKELRSIDDTLKGILDVYRQSQNLPPISREPADQQRERLWRDDFDDRGIIERGRAIHAARQQAGRGDGAGDDDDDRSRVATSPQSSPGRRDDRSSTLRTRSSTPENPFAPVAGRGGAGGRGARRGGARGTRGGRGGGSGSRPNTRSRGGA